MFLNDPEAMLRVHHAEHAVLMEDARRRHPLHRRSFTHESPVHHAARWMSVMAYHYASHVRRSLRHATHARAPLAPAHAPVR